MIGENPDGSLSYREGLGELVDRHDKELRRKYSIDYEVDETKNLVLVVGGKIALRAIEDKIIILLDKFKSGYECSMCGGSGEGRRCIDCVEGVNSRGFKCKVCDGVPDRWVGKTCPQCKGRGSTIIIPDSAKALPTSGTIVSVGPDCKSRKVGQRVVFGAHVGFFLPFKGNVRLRMMREYEPLCELFLLDTDNSVLGDFLQVDENPDNTGDL
jgi:co-chaperonin GroES (HSP10)